MTRRFSLPIIALAFALTAAKVSAADDNGPGMMGGPMMGEGMMNGGMMGMMGGSMARRQAFMQNGVPAPYAGLTDPLRPTPSTLTLGKTLYSTNCRSCHGAEGLGNGEAGKSLVPPPANIAATARMPMPDNFFFWTISDGGQPFGTAMPAFRDSLKPNEIWAIITYLRAGLPQNPGG